MKTLIFMNFLSLFIFGSVTSGFSFTLIIGISYMSVICYYFICYLLWEKAKWFQIWFSIKISLYNKSTVLANLKKYWLFNIFKEFSTIFALGRLVLPTETGHFSSIIPKNFLFHQCIFSIFSDCSKMCMVLA